jgi:hypothetical protein
MVLKRKPLLSLALVSALCLAQTLQPAPPSGVKVEDAGKPLPRAYQKTHGHRITGPALPYVEEYAHESQIDLDKIESQLFPRGLPPAGLAISISSVQRMTGDWTYVRSGSAVIYELLKVRTADGTPLVLVLYSSLTPAGIIADRSHKPWHLSLFDEQSKRIADTAFPARIPHEEEGMWDMITTSLSLEKGSPVAKIEYSHTGGGGAREQEFTAGFEITRNPTGLRLIRSRQTRDSYP